MATYKAEFLYHYFKGRLRPLHMWLFGYMFRWAKLASLAPGIANFFSQAPPFATLLKRIAGIAPKRHVPLFADHTFRAWYTKRKPRNASTPLGASSSNGDRRVILWPDTWNNHFHPQTAQAAVEVLEDAGYHVILPQRQICCGRPLYDYGLLDAAKRQLVAIMDELRPLIREGVPLVALEPSCLSVFKDELHEMLGHDIDAMRLAQQSFMFETFLNKKSEYHPPRLDRAAVVHEHCHKKSVLDPLAETHAFKDMGLQFTKLESGCCGMAGAFGFEGSHYEMSIACGERVLLPKVREAKPETIVVADGFSCREQIVQTTQRQALHPAEVMRMAIDDRGFDRDDAYPERRFVEDPAQRRRQIIVRGYAVLAGVAVATALVTLGAVGLRTRR
jgi:Fe-S oxidoreductase